jgi:hypothetical protein
VQGVELNRVGNGLTDENTKTTDAAKCGWRRKCVPRERHAAIGRNNDAIGDAGGVRCGMDGQRQKAHDE